MKTDKTIIDISLEDAAFKYANKNIKPNYCMDDFIIPFEAGANWQKEKDKAIQDKLVENLARLIDRIIENDLQNQFPSAFNRAQELIKSIEQ